MLLIIGFILLLLLFGARLYCAYRFWAKPSWSRAARLRWRDCAPPEGTLQQVGTVNAANMGPRTSVLCASAVLVGTEKVAMEVGESQ